MSRSFLISIRQQRLKSQLTRPLFPMYEEEVAAAEDMAAGDEMPVEVPNAPMTNDNTFDIN